MDITPAYPTPEHAAAAEAIAGFFAGRPEVAALLLTGSCARGKASPDSCLDLVALIPPEVPAATRAEVERLWREFESQDAACRAMSEVGVYSGADLDFADGCFAPQGRGWTSGPDVFELEIGNTLAYTAALVEQGDYLAQLKDQWLPYYGEELRRERLAEARRYCLNNLDHIPLYAPRGLAFQSFHRMYDAFREFLQALFISRRTYPIAYDKWVREQVEEILGLPDLYRQLPSLFEFGRFESLEVVVKAQRLRDLLGEYVSD